MEWKYKGEGREEDYVGRRVMGMEVQGRWKRGRLRRKEGDGNGSTREKEERKTLENTLWLDTVDASRGHGSLLSLRQLYLRINLTNGSVSIMHQVSAQYTQSSTMQRR